MTINRMLEQVEAIVLVIGEIHSEMPAGQVGEIAVTRQGIGRDTDAPLVVFRDLKDVVLALFRRGYRLGLVCRSTQRGKILAALSELKIRGCFEALVFLPQASKDKPGTDMLLAATEQMDISPEKCVYVGDHMDWDVHPVRKAGFAQVILLQDSAVKRTADALSEESEKIITHLDELLGIFPPRLAPQPAEVYAASLSTMWAIRNFPTLLDFFEAARRLGFAKIELNHRVTSEMLEGIDLDAYDFSSVHEPCPADISEAELKKQDWLISSTDEAHRQEGVRAIMHSIDLAQRAGARLVVVHAGHTVPDHDGLEMKLRSMVELGQQDSDVYRDIQKEMIRLRQKYATASFASVLKSIQELLAYASARNICVGIENRYHYLEHPNLDELGVLLSLSTPQQVGLVYDVGHAYTLERLGFIPHLAWLQRYAARIVGIHLHDVKGVTDHYTPGTGEVDFERIAAVLPETAVHTLELNRHLHYGEVRDALSYLVQRSCVLHLQDGNQRNGE